MLMLIIGNSVVMGLQSELPYDMTNLHSVLEMFDLFSLFMFILEVKILFTMIEK